MGRTLGLIVKVNLPNFDKDFDVKSKKYLDAVGLVFKASVFRFLGLVIRYSRVDTGRLKSAWTPIMDSQNFDYTKFWVYGNNEKPEAIAEGKQEGSFQYDPTTDPFKIIVVNSVKYAEIVEEKYGVTVKGSLPTLAPYFEQYFLEGYDYLNKGLDDSFDSGRYPGTNDLPSEVY